MSIDFQAGAQRWLAGQPEGALRLAREIIWRRAEQVKSNSEDEHSGRMQAHYNGVLAGMRLALSMIGDRPGDISNTGAEGYIMNVQLADEMIAMTAARPSVPDV